MKVAFTIPDTTVDIAVAMIRAQVEDANPQEKQALEAAKGVDCVQLDSAEVFDDQQTVVLISLALAAVSNYLK